MADSPINGLLVTGLLAVLGTVTGGVVKGYWDTQHTEMKFQSDLILKALEPEETAARVASLKFLVTANLITDSDIRNGVLGIIEEGGDSVPQFTSVRTKATGGGAREALEKKFPELDGKNVALVGFKVRHGDIIDAVTPIYSAVSPELELLGEFEGKKIGGDGGGETRLMKPGHVITEISVQRGKYFGDSHVAHFQVTWTPMTANGVDATASVRSERIGGGNYVKALQAVEVYNAKRNGFISDFVATVGRHSNGDVFLKSFEVQETMVLSSQ